MHWRITFWNVHAFLTGNQEPVVSHFLLKNLLTSCDQVSGGGGGGACVIVL